MLDAVIEYLPSPLDVPDVVGSNPSNEEEKLTRKASADGALRSTGVQGSAHPFYGQLTYTRVYSGTAAQGQQVLNSTKGKKERIE